MKFNNTLSKLASAVALSTLAATSFAEDGEKEAQDMSDPMAIYTSGGISYGTNGLNLKIMKTLDTGSPTKASAIIVEIKDMNFHDNNEIVRGRERSSDPSELRLRKFDVDMTTGRGISYDIVQSLDKNISWPNKDLNRQGMASVGMMQALPVVKGVWTAYPIIGAGLWYGEKAKEGENEGGGIDMSGVSLNFTMYNKFTVTNKIWLNWNLTYMQGVYGSDYFKDHMNSADDSLSHEFIISYQVNPYNNLRLWYNASQKQFSNDDTGETRLEYNRQF